MRVTIAGGNGYIGRALTRLLRQNGHEITWLSHTPGKAAGAGDAAPEYEVVLEPHDFDGAWTDEVRAADAVVNLSGYPISSRWNTRIKHELRDSRVEVNRSFIRCIGDLEPGDRPATFVSASGIGYYGDRGDTVLAETEPAGTDFLGRLARDWEAEALRAEEHGVRVVVVRNGIVLGDEGLVPRMSLPFKFFVGGPVGTGRQWVSWVHIDDIAAIYAHAVETTSLRGPVNAAGDPVTMKQLAGAMGSALHRPSWLPVPRFALRIVLGEVADYTLMSQRADTRKLAESGFAWQHREVRDAMIAVVDNSKSAGQTR